MARIRSIKPEFFTSLTIGALSPLARLTFIGLWTHVDDDGRTIDDTRLIRAAVWPLDDRSLAEVDKDLAQLSDAGLLVRYEVDGRRYLAVSSWEEHQRVSHPKPSRYPAPPLDSRNPPEPSGNSPEESGELPPRAGAEQGAGSREMEQGDGEQITDAIASDGQAVVVIDADVEIVEGDLIEPGEDEARPSNVIALRPSDPPLPFGETLDADEPVNGGQIMAAWIGWKKPSLSRHDRGRQAAAAARIADGRTMGEVRRAMVGMDCIWPYAPPTLVKGSEGRHWDLMNLEKDFNKALAGALNHPVIRRAREDAEWDAAFDNAQGW